MRILNSYLTPPGAESSHARWKEMGRSIEVRVLLIGLAVLLGLIVGMTTGLLACLSESSMSVAIRHGGVAFGGTVTLSILIMNALGLL
jgi:hypothetical protein